MACNGTSSDTPALAAPNARQPSPNPATFSWLAANVFQPKCVQCHSGAGAQAGVDLSSYQAIQNAPATHGHAIVEGGDPNDSHLYDEVQDGSMPPAGTLPKVTPSELSALHDWIQGGAQNN